jgi:tetratricopeptide (TPR) repeat protein
MNFQIKKCCALLLALLAFAQYSFAAGETHFRAGVAAYEAGQYDLAARAFSDALAKKTAPGTLLNLGLAEWRGGHPGAAVVAWEQATWLDPFNRDARNNLLYAQETAQFNPPELTWFEQASTWLPANCWTWIAGGSLWLAVALVTVPGFFRMRKAGWHQTVAALALGVFLLSLAPSAGIITRSKIGIVTGEKTSLRLTPTQSAEIVTPLPPGEPVRALRQHGDYFLVHTQNGNGWVGRGQIKFLCPAASAR